MTYLALPIKNFFSYTQQSNLFVASLYFAFAPHERFVVVVRHARLARDVRNVGMCTRQFRGPEQGMIESDRVCASHAWQFCDA